MGPRCEDQLDYWPYRPTIDAHLAPTMMFWRGVWPMTYLLTDDGITSRSMATPFIVFDEFWYRSFRPELAASIFHAAQGFESEERVGKSMVMVIIITIALVSRLIEVEDDATMLFVHDWLMKAPVQCRVQSSHSTSVSNILSPDRYVFLCSWLSRFPGSIIETTINYRICLVP